MPNHFKSIRHPELVEGQNLFVILSLSKDFYPSANQPQIRKKKSCLSEAKSKIRDTSVSELAAQYKKNNNKTMNSFFFLDSSRRRTERS